MSMIALNDGRLTILRHSSSVIGLVHAPSIDLATGAFQCSETCHYRMRPHKHSAELVAVKAALDALQATKGISRYEAVLALSRILKVQARMGDDLLQFQCGQHPDQIAEGGGPWVAPDTLTHQAVRLILADREAIKAAERKGARKVAA